MTASPLLKIATLASFALLLSGFVAYRAGAFAGLLNGEKGNLGQIATDDSQIAIDSPPPRATYFSSSKSAIIIDKTDRQAALPDSTAAADTTLVAVDSAALQEMQILSGSKQGLIFEPPVKQVKKKRNRKNH